MPPFIARIGWSGNGRWDGPSVGGGVGETPGSFRHDVGFGFEDWFLDFRHALSDGCVYSMLQPVYRSRKAQSGQVLDLLVYTISPDGRRFYVGRLLAAEVLDRAEALTAYNEFKALGWFAEREDQIRAVKIDVASFAQAAPDEHFSLRFRPEDWRPEPGGLREADSGDYICGHGHNRYVLADTQHIAKNVISQWTPPGTTTLKSVIASDAAPVPGHPVDLQHNRIQNQLFVHLSARYPGHVSMEKGYVDIWVDHPDEDALIEVKSSLDACSAVREALGQLLEYAWIQPGPAIATTYRLIVAAPAPRSERLDSYLATLHERYGLHLEYLQVVEGRPVAWVSTGAA